MVKLDFVMLQNKLGGGNLVFADLLRYAPAWVKCRAICGATRHPETVALRNADFVGFKSRGILSRAASLVLLYATLASAAIKGEWLVYSDPVLAMIMPFLPGWRKIRYVQADDMRLFDENKKLPFLLRAVYKVLNHLSYNQPGVVTIFNSRFSYERYARFSLRRLKPIIVNPGFDDGSYRVSGLERSSDIAVLARDEPIKGLDTVRKALSLLGSEGLRGRTVVFFGAKRPASVPDGVAFVLCANAGDNARVLNSSDIFIFPSLREGFGLPPLEAMACGCLVISSDCGGVREYGRDGHNILFFRAGSAESLAGRLGDAMGRPDREEIRRRGTATAGARGKSDSVRLFYQAVSSIMEAGRGRSEKEIDDSPKWGWSK